MSRTARYAWILVLLIPAGCTRDEQYLEVFREQRANFKEMGDILASVKDDDSMAAAKVKLEERRPHFDATARKASALPRPLPAEVARRFEEEKYLMTSFLERMQTQMKRIRGLKGGEEFITYFESNAPGLMSAVKQ